jgi:catalase (peroxidase I)
MGFNQQEMIGLIACGHSIGGVHHQSFPSSNIIFTFAGGMSDRFL